MANTEDEACGRIGTTPAPLPTRIIAPYIDNEQRKLPVKCVLWRCAPIVRYRQRTLSRNRPSCDWLFETCVFVVSFNTGDCGYAFLIPLFILQVPTQCAINKQSNAGADGISRYREYTMDFVARYPFIRYFKYEL